MAESKGPAEGWRADDDEERPVPVGVDPAIPSPARMYDYYLGGKDNYAVDREAAEKALSVVPYGRRIARANRYFLMRAVLLMADQGIRQFIDLGTGIPTSPSVHELAHAIQPGAHVLYVDNDAVVTAHNRALLARSPSVRAMQADIREPESILDSLELLDFIDFREPVGILFVAVLHFVKDSEDPAGIIRAFASHTVSGSYLALSHITSDGTDPGAIETIRQAYTHASAPAVFRTTAEIGAFFAGFDLISPGLVDVTRWSPFSAVFTSEPPALRVLSGIGRKIDRSESESSARAALENLAAALNARDHITTLITGDNRPPRLSVASRHAPLGEDIYAEAGSYWWSWAERIAPVDSPAEAARKVSRRLQAALEAAHG